jgi:hypothetical protein
MVAWVSQPWAYTSTRRAEGTKEKAKAMATGRRLTTANRYTDSTALTAADGGYGWIDSWRLSTDETRTRRNMAASILYIYIYIWVGPMFWYLPWTGIFSFLTYSFHPFFAIE